MKKYYWLVAGALVGFISVVLAFVNFQLLVVNNTISTTGTVIVVVEYAVVIYVLSLIEKKIK